MLYILGAALLIGAIGVLIDSTTGPSSSAAALCTEPAPPVKGRQQQDATLEYRRLWSHAAPLLGSEGQPPPRLRFVGADASRPGPNDATWTGPDAGNCRTIFITPGVRRLLADVGDSRQERRHHRVALRWTLHETAHYYQSDAVLANKSLREYGATGWEKAHSPAIVGKGKAPLPFNQWRDHDQFGSNFGGNPRTFLWPTEVEPAEPLVFR